MEEEKSLSRRVLDFCSEEYASRQLKVAEWILTSLSLIFAGWLFLRGQSLTNVILTVPFAALQLKAAFLSSEARVWRKLQRGKVTDKALLGSNPGQSLPALFSGLCKERHSAVGRMYGAVYFFILNIADCFDSLAFAGVRVDTVQSVPVILLRAMIYAQSFFILRTYPVVPVRRNWLFPTSVIFAAIVYGSSIYVFEKGYTSASYGVRSFLNWCRLALLCVSALLMLRELRIAVTATGTDIASYVGARSKGRAFEDLTIPQQSRYVLLRDRKRDNSLARLDFFGFLEVFIIVFFWLTNSCVWGEAGSLRELSADIVLESMEMISVVSQFYNIMHIEPELFMEIACRAQNEDLQDSSSHPSPVV